MRSVHFDCVFAEEWPIRLLGMFTLMTFASRRFMEMEGLSVGKLR